MADRNRRNRRNQKSCYICIGRFDARNTMHIHGADREQIREIAIAWREEFDRAPLVIEEDTRVCFSCYQSILREIELMQHPYSYKLNVLRQTRNDSCFICNNRHDVQRLALDCKIDVFVRCNIYMPDTVRSCNAHLDGRGFILRPLLAGLRCLRRHIVIPRDQVKMILEAMRNHSLANERLNDVYDFSDDEMYTLTSLTKEQFNILFTYCDGIPGRRIGRKDLLIFLCKMRQGLSDEFLCLLFQQNSRRDVSLTIAAVRQSLMMRFVPENIGINAITRRQYIQNHVTEFANGLYNRQPDVPVAIAYVDGTYNYCHKSSNFRALRQTFCRHKGGHLIKPALV
ncbi:unnamed protein product [Trichogramma brassicae]|uniref:Uncharacterized protein n=1 Tax=Trichogramma brassicae TaxID=86971 RepID=A0A6H5I0W3_9HYME|nr:unnamed protein product [Trichogramma brassicae]